MDTQTATAIGEYFKPTRYALEAMQLADAAGELANRAHIEMDPAWLAPVDPAAGSGDLREVLARIDRRGHQLSDVLDNLEGQLALGRPDRKLALPIVQELCAQARDHELAVILHLREQDAR